MGAMFVENYSGQTLPLSLTLFRLAGFRVVIVVHRALWGSWSKTWGCIKNSASVPRFEIPQINPVSIGDLLPLLHF